MAGTTEISARLTEPQWKLDIETRRVSYISAAGHPNTRTGYLNRQIRKLQQKYAELRGLQCSGISEYWEINGRVEELESNEQQGQGYYHLEAKLTVLSKGLPIYK